MLDPDAHPRARLPRASPHTYYEILKVSHAIGDFTTASRVIHRLLTNLGYVRGTYQQLDNIIRAIVVRARDGDKLVKSWEGVKELTALSEKWGGPVSIYVSSSFLHPSSPPFLNNINHS